jgi:adenylate cyclase
MCGCIARGRPPLAETAPRSYIVAGQNIVTESVYERPADERPRHDTIEGIARWLNSEARAEASFTRLIDEFGWRLIAAGHSLLRVSIHGGTLHPQFRGSAHLWWRDCGQTQKIMITYEVADIIPYPENPVRRVREGEETLRRRLADKDGPFEFAVLEELRARGATEYFALPVASPFGFGNYMMTYVSDRAGGFTEREIAELTRLSECISVLADMSTQKLIAENVLRAYLGTQTGPRVLAGEIRRGSGEEIAAVIWSSDLRGFTALSDHAPGERVIAILNDLFDLQATAIAKHGGEILKFIGDGLLAIFPVAEPGHAARAAAGAVAAARETLAALEAYRGHDQAPLRIVIALHYGTVIYGNIGAADRLDFTVIGPAVNLVSRAEAIAKSLDQPLIVTDDLAAVYQDGSGAPLRSLGRHRLRGLDREHELFAPVSE